MALNPKKQTSQKSGWWGDFSTWLSSPFSVDMSATEWFLFIGLLLVIMIIWRLLLRTIEEAL